MNELLQKHGCSNVFFVPEGLKELMSDITREVLREQPTNIYRFISNYLSALLITREHGVLSLKILEDLCDCRPTVSEHLMQIGIEPGQASKIARIIQEEIEGFEPIEGKEKLRESMIVQQILKRNEFDDETIKRVCDVIRTAYKDYWYRKKLLEKRINQDPSEPWEKACAFTLELYKRTRPSITELNRATVRIQAAYRGYHIRKKMFQKLEARPVVPGPKLELVGAPIDIAESREIDLGHIVNVKVKEDELVTMYADHIGETLGLQYNPMSTLTHSDGESKTQKKQSKKRVLSLVCEESEKRQQRDEDVVSPTSSELVSQVSPLSLNKKISFAGEGPEIISIPDDDHDIIEELTVRGAGDGDSASSVSTESPSLSAVITDDEDEDENLQ